MTPVIHVAVCDDNEFYTESIRKTVAKVAAELQLSVKVETFISEERMMAAGAEHFKLFLLGNTPGSDNGMLAAGDIRLRNRNSVIIVTSPGMIKNADAKWPDLYRYLINSHDKEKVNDTIRSALTQVVARDMITLCDTFTQQMVNAPFREMTHIEASRNNTIVYLKKGGVATNIPISYWELNLNERFVQVHRWYFVNLGAVKKREENAVVVTTGEKIPVGEEYSKSLDVRLAEYRQK